MKIPATASVSPVTGNTIVNLKIDGEAITLQLVNGTTLVVNSRDSNLTINTRMKTMPLDKDLLCSEVGVLGLSKKVEHQLYKRGIDLIFQLVEKSSRKELFGLGYYRQLSPSREKWCDEVEMALAKRGLFLGMAIDAIFPFSRTSTVL